MSEIRKLRREELSESVTLSEFAFQYELSDAEREEQVGRMNPDEHWGFFEEGRLAAKLQLLNFHTWLNGRRFAMGGIAGVATWPEYRRNGMVARLLGQTLQTMREQGQTLSFLAPFKFEFYRRYGWETYVDYMRYEIPADKLPKFEAPAGGTVRRIAPDWEQLNPLYAEYAQRYNGMLVRDEDWWTKRHFKSKKGTVAVYENARGERRGYVHYQVKERTATIHELVCLDEEARRGLWKFIADHDSMIAKIVVKAPSDDQLPFLLHDPTIKQEKLAYFMARIVDAEAFLAQYAYAPRPDAEPLHLRITDPHAEWNQGIFRLQFAGGGTSAQAARLAGLEAPDEEGLLSCSIQTLAALFLGYQTPSFMAGIGRLQGSPELVARLEAALPRRTTFLLDFF
ncbi:GNAT family N-acetyltransferase [Paenibacillus sp. GCM10023250]|uniref:GNAT family N-acetyltransferase n=1 Tax=Paenibacillus sp. GCM10023250 TaxID=3252648 RepID=UPI00361AAB1C